MPNRRRQAIFVCHRAYICVRLIKETGFGILPFLDETDLDLADGFELIATEGREDDAIVQAIDEFGTEVLANGVHYLLLGSLH